MLGEFFMVIFDEMVDYVIIECVKMKCEIYCRGWCGMIDDVYYGLGWCIYDLNGL